GPAGRPPRAPRGGDRRVRLPRRQQPRARLVRPGRHGRGAPRPGPGRGPARPVPPRHRRDRPCRGDDRVDRAAPVLRGESRRARRPPVRGAGEDPQPASGGERRRDPGARRSRATRRGEPTRAGGTMTRGMVLAAGLGTRLGPLSDELPKPLLPVANIPLVRWALALLRRAGIAETVVNLHHRGDAIAAELDGEVRFSREDTILGTGGGIRRAL